jgi:hypothetical protein
MGTGYVLKIGALKPATIAAHMRGDALARMENLAKQL